MPCVGSVVGAQGKKTDLPVDHSARFRLKTGFQIRDADKYLFCDIGTKENKEVKPRLPVSISVTGRKTEREGRYLQKTLCFIVTGRWFSTGTNHLSVSFRLKNAG